MMGKGVHPQLQNKQRSFMAFGFGADQSRRESYISINVAPTSHEVNDTPEIRKYKKRFNSEILCASLWGKSWLVLCHLVVQVALDLRDRCVPRGIVYFKIDVK
ncbi:Mitogen-activated protein kinase kinase kinase kinase 4 [Portunus trituberculatus]|uniref:Mitogen-activated protein kinase kinase kinase kinase 4 n=1 Tax=Portunus trituberculatus TaxID=210409 RepID=A0A5B7IES2_PORTR|nr:Mitogen-activated protein kinase kinase kinase kinase 4 [Portunus trituberculatus]